MFRFNNPDALLVLLLTARGVRHGAGPRSGPDRAGWCWPAHWSDSAFLAKELQALVVVPALALAYLVAGPPRLRPARLAVAGGGAALVIAGGWWVLAVQLTPAADRPYIGGSQNNSLWNVIFGYNGFGRLTGNESGSVGGGGGAGGTGMWGPTGWKRLFLADMGGQISWLLPAAVVVLAVGLWWTRRAPRTDRNRAALVLWGVAMLVTALVFSFGQGIIHPYYTVALAPLIAATLAIGVNLAWQRRSSLLGRSVMALAVLVTAIWAYVLLDRSSSWHPWLRVLIVVLAAVAAAGLLAWPYLRGRSMRFAVAGVALVAALAGPTGYTLNTVSQPHNGAIPSAGPAVSGGRGFPGFGGGRQGVGGGAPGRRWHSRLPGRGRIPGTGRGSGRRRLSRRGRGPGHASPALRRQWGWDGGRLRRRARWRWGSRRAARRGGGQQCGSRSSEGRQCSFHLARGHRRIRECLQLSAGHRASRSCPSEDSTELIRRRPWPSSSATWPPGRSTISLPPVPGSAAAPGARAPGIVTRSPLGLSPTSRRNLWAGSPSTT